MAEGFLGRWSRRKQEVREGVGPREDDVAPAQATPLASAPASAAPQPPHPQQGEECAAAAPPPQAPPTPSLADAQALTPASDFTPFIARDVAPEVRNLAMKKLFADPHFNAMDGLDIYVGDYTQPDPLPAGMLRKMASAHALGFFKAEESAKSAEPAPLAAPPMAQPGGQAPGPSPQAAAPGVAQSGACTADAGGFPSEPGAEAAASPPCGAAAAMAPASQAEHDQDADLRLQPDDAARRPGAGRGAA